MTQNTTIDTNASTAKREAVNEMAQTLRQSGYALVIEHADFFRYEVEVWDFGPNRHSDGALWVLTAGGDTLEEAYENAVHRGYDSMPDDRLVF